ncbi:MAG: DUF4352 domain-containing protein [Woeseiaceae bacterium]|nr:DUF4352 domain-containing protein [Woeseiaceae bacterium]
MDSLAKAEIELNKLRIVMKKLFILLSLSILCLFSSFSWSAETKVEAGQQKSGSELNFPDYSPLGQRIANGESVKAKVFFWIKADGTIGSTKRGWRRVPKSSRHLVYLDRNKAEQAVQDSSKSPEERAQIEKQRSKEEMRNVSTSHFVGRRFTQSSKHYIGEKYNGYPHGKGTYTLPNGDQYIGNFHRGKSNGFGTYTWASGDKYVGGWWEGFKSFRGTYTWASGNKYKGQWRYSQRHGHGTTTYTDGTIEEGFWAYDELTDLTGPNCSDRADKYSAFSWHNCIGYRMIDGFYEKDHLGWYQNGQANGEGFSSDDVYVKETRTPYRADRKDERYYVGNFKNGKAEGQGTSTWEVDHVYTGEHKDGQPHGQGSERFPNGDKYVGEVKNNTRDGKGTYTWPNGDKYVGWYLNNKRHGPGKRTNINGSNYEGEYKNGELVKGIKTWANGSKYIGQFKDSESHGVGNFYRTDESMMGGIWKNDEPLEVYSGYKCSGDSASWSDCIGTLTLANGIQFIGKFLDGKTSGKGTLIFPDSRPMQFVVEPTEQELVTSSYEKDPAIGDIVQTKYFEVTVNSAYFRDWIGSFSDRTVPGPENKFLVIEVNYKNTDNEARVLMAGALVVRVDGKEFLFDQPEVVFAKGYIAFDSLNPMVTREGNVVFKVPEVLKGDIFYRPARSTELIKLK